MRTNPIRDRWQQDKAVVSGWVGFDSPFVAELLAHLPFDSMTIDMQHGLVDYQTAISMLQGISVAGIGSLVRVPWNEPGIIMKMLDAGAFGIICPMVNSRAEAEAFVGACLYPPDGYRSHGPRRAPIVIGEEYAAQANDFVLPIAMIETAQAVDNLDDILSVPGLGGIYIGPADLSRSYGYPPRMDLTDPFLVSKLDLILAKAQEHSVPAGIHVGASAYAREMIDKGWLLTTISSDSGFLLTAARQALADLGRNENAEPSGPY
jgi:4-hydroxy-2-oxoheptanedioate aldolase